ncbi:hypothetical protein OIO90_000981 [Microbotryomycetes sp. JL221]|nr:hypothetical protein OIO90_000981 [Microbotryomycetes sp. JL221]
MTEVGEDFEASLITLEQQFYAAGYNAGQPHGSLHGLFEGRALGREKAWDMWTELGHYEGTARLLLMIIESQGASSSRSHVTLQHLLESIESIPMLNESEQAKAAAMDVDIPALLNSARSKYRTACATVGVRPRLATVSE